jgi:hypothetical protein
VRRCGGLAVGEARAAGGAVEEAVLAVAAVAHADGEPAGVGDQDARGQGLQQVVVVAVAAAGLVADLEAVGQALEGAEHLLDAADLAAAHPPPRIVQYTFKDTFYMYIEYYVIHNDLHKSGCAGTQATYLHVTRLTEAPFIVSRRSKFGGSAFAPSAPLIHRHLSCGGRNILLRVQDRATFAER